MGELFRKAQECHHSRRFGEAVSFYSKILEENPRHADTLNLLGTALAQDGEPEKGLEFLRRAIDEMPDKAPYRVNLGVILQDLSKYDEAQGCYESAIKIDDTFGDAYYNLAKLYKEMGLFDAALLTYDNLLSIEPNHQNALLNIGNIFFEFGLMDRSIEYFDKASKIKIGLEKSDDRPLINLANAHRRKGDDEKAIQIYGKILGNHFHPGILLKQATTLPVVYRDRSHIRISRQSMINKINSISKESLSLSDPALEISSTNFFLAYQAMPNRDLQEKLSQIILNACPQIGFTAPHCYPLNNPKGKVRIGFLSAYFRRHSIGRLTQGLICNISKNNFEVIVLTLPGQRGRVAEDIQGHADKVVFIPDDTFAAQKIIAAEELDILFYTDIGMDVRTYFLAFARLAPVQCVTWGHPDTTGIPNIDFFISSNLIEPNGADMHYSEKLLLLDSLPTYYYPIVTSGEMKSKGDFGCPSDMTLYLCPQSAIKFHPDLDFVFGEILRRDEKALIVVIEGVVKDWTVLVQQRWRKTIPDAKERIKVLTRQTPENFIALQNAADVILDTPHFSGGNTSLEAFALARPVVTHDGEFMRGRVTAGMYRMMGIESCIANDLDDYIGIALKLGRDTNFRDLVSRQIRASNNVLFENSRVIEEFERLFQSVFSARKI